MVPLHGLRKERSNRAVPRRLLHVARLAVESLEDRTVLSTVYGLAPNNLLLRFDSATPGTVVNVGTVNVGAGETLQGIDFRPRTGELFGSTVTTGSAANSILTTYKINPLTAQATLVGATAAALAGAGDVGTGYDFNPTVDRIRYVNGNDENARLNPNNGALAGNDTDLTPSATTDIIGAAYDRNFDRQTIAAPNNNVIPTTLFVINRSTSMLARQGGADGNPSPNAGVVTDLATLGFTLAANDEGGFDIAPGAGAGRAFASLTDAVDGLVRLYTINLAGAANVATRIGLIGAGTTEIFSIAVQPDNYIAVGADAGGGSHVKAFDSVTNVERFSFFAYPGFNGDVRVAVGDVSGDGVGDIITGAGTGGNSHVKVFDGLTGAEIRSFFAYQGFAGGVNVAGGDLNADGFDEVITGADANGHVKAFDGRTGAELLSFLAYPGFLGGVNVAAGDFDLDGVAEIVTGVGFSGQPHVKVFNSTGALFTSAALPNFLNSFFAYEVSLFGGVTVAVGDVTGDGRPDIITAIGAGGGTQVKAFSGISGANTATFSASPGFNGATRVAAADTNGDARDDIIFAHGADRASNVRSFDGLSLTALDNIFAFPGFFGGEFVGG